VNIYVCKYICTVHYMYFSTYIYVQVLAYLCIFFVYICTYLHILCMHGLCMYNSVNTFIYIFPYQNKSVFRIQIGSGFTIQAKTCSCPFPRSYTVYPHGNFREQKTDGRAVWLVSRPSLDGFWSFFQFWKFHYHIL
jgi:hypothetical protein